VYVAATTDCFPDLPLADAVARLVELQYTRIEITLHEQGMQLKPSEVAADLERAIARCHEIQRLTPVAYSIDLPPGGARYYTDFAACCKLAKATKVATVSVPASELGTPFNEEIERLRELVRLAAVESVRVGIRTQVGRVTQDPDTTKVLCDNVKGLGVALDPSHYLCGPHGGASFDQLFKYVYHVYLRDTSKENMQVRVGQGQIAYSRLISQLNRVGYQNAVSVDIKPMPDVDHDAEMRKMRLLLESLLF